MKILGLNAYHGDSAAALVINGQLVAAAEEERFRRIKHWAGFPCDAVRYCIQEAGLKLDDLDVIALNQDPRANFWRKAVYTLTRRPDPRLIWDRIKNKRKREGIASQLHRTFPGQRFAGRLEAVEHHRAHLFSAFYVSPFEEATVVSVDGFGDFASGAWGVGRGTEISVDGRVLFPHSMGIFYQALTQFLGFPSYGDEYKVMGLAPYGQPEFLDTMRQIVRLDSEEGAYALNLDYFRHHKVKIAFDWDGGAPVIGRLYSDALGELLGEPRRENEPLTQRHKDIAHSVQAIYEEAFFHLLNQLHRRHGINALALAGGCAMNSVANGKVAQRTPFKRLYVQPAAGDAGGAVGAAFAKCSELDSGRPRFRMSHAYWGPAFCNERIERLVESRKYELEAAGCRIERMPDDETLCRTVAKAVSEGQVVGWFQGRMEWGPRALGNRSIVCDPRRADMKETLNRKIKRRESFRPFAPAILRDAVFEWFEQDDDVPFMMKAFQIRPDKRDIIPAVTHVDGSGRLQTVTRESNARYYDLIRTFEEISGVPVLLNTSFNENEPVVCRPEEAMDCFLRTNMDILVIQEWLISREKQEISPCAGHREE